NCDFTVNPNDPNFNKDEKTTYGYSTHYGLWITHYGHVSVNNCNFHDIPYGGIKSVYGANDYSNYRKKNASGQYVPSDITLSVTNSTFENIGNGEKHRPIHLDGANGGADSVVLTGNTFTDCWTDEDADSSNAQIIDSKTTVSSIDAINADYRGENTNKNTFRYTLQYKVGDNILSKTDYYQYAKENKPVETYYNGYEYIGKSGTVYSGKDLQIENNTSGDAKTVTSGSAGKRMYTLTKAEPAVPLQYDVKFNANGGSGSMSAQSMTYDQDAALTKNAFTKDGCTFKGWATTADGAVKYHDGETVKNLTGDETEVTLYAVWEKNETPVVIPSTPSDTTKTTPQKHEVTFHDDNASGSTPETTVKITVDENGMVQKPAQDPVREGYTFDGWYADQACTIPFDFSKPVTGDVHIYAKWNKNVKPETSGKVSGVLLLKAAAKGTSREALSWTSVKNADGYFVYAAKCNTAKKSYAFKKVADVKASMPAAYTQSGLKKGTMYKYRIAAYQVKNGKKTVVKKSLTAHTIAGDSNGKYTNAKKITVKKNAVTLKAGKKYQIQPSVTGVVSGLKILQKGHALMFRYVYVTQNNNVSVSKTGLVTTKKAGKCKIYVIGVNGVRTAVNVTVK
ncbi:MAG: InlB B-repeat-containing protein, partial [Eubacterium sp.]